MRKDGSESGAREALSFELLAHQYRPFLEKSDQRFIPLSFFHAALAKKR